MLKLSTMKLKEYLLVLLYFMRGTHSSQLSEGGLHSFFAYTITIIMYNFITKIAII